ncbi:MULTISPECIES: PASTA domain-containing protein [unclassified Lacticaseibacillus]|uniref:PASTA domain-containing protein n=1 Tax=unclassified Lacticaseibacillus TaxID=2759744 RepID=UPI001942629B|nr:MULTISPECIES: PASTA domain-containing protein [unclassified Lacticaseibacillus]
MTNSKSSTGGLKKLAGKTFNVADKLISGVGSVADAIAKVAPSVVDEGAKVVDAHMEKHKDDFKMPALVDLPLEEAKRVLDFYHLQYALIMATPAPKLATRQPNVILETTPKANTKVAPNAFVRAYYATEETIETSRQMIATRQAAKAEAKANKQAARQAQLHTVTRAAAAIPAAMAGKLPRRKSKKRPTPPSANSQTGQDDEPGNPQ